jgi:HlyD family secretion protein
MDRLLSKEIITRRRNKYIASGVAVVLLVIVVMGMVSVFFTPRIDSKRIILAVAESGDIEASLTATGTVVAKYETAISSPVETSILTVFHKAGEKIHQGDQLLKLNKEFLQISYEKLKDELELDQNKKLQKQISLKNSSVESHTAYEIQELVVKYNASKYNREERLVKIGASTKENLEGVSLSLEQSVREKEKLRMQMENETTLQQAEIAELDLEIRIQEKSLKQLRRQIELADIKAEGDGIITWINDKTGTTVANGEVIARISDLSGFRIDCEISDINASKVAIGGKVKIKLTDVSIPGFITAVNPAVSNGTVQFTVAVDGQYYPRLRLNQSLEVFVVTSGIRNVMRVKNGPFYNGFTSQEVFVVTGNKAVKRPVEFGESDMEYIEIKKGIAAGERVIISDMKGYENYHELEIQ